MLKHLAAAMIACAALIAGTAFADEASIKKAVEAIFPGAKVDSVKKTTYLGLYEVRAGGELIYTDEKVTYIITGDIIEAKTKKNLTQERINKLSQINFADLPLDLAVKQVRGSGKRVIATFEDPNCGYCKKLAKDMQSMNDVTIYTFLYPILSPDSTEKSKAIWCSADRVKAWNDWMVNGVSPTGKTDCNAPIEKVVEIGQRLNIRGTPTIFLSNGSRLPGAVPLARLEQEMASAAAGK
ncbi:MAG TPA: DsbC family protein [Rhodocyclaceae bacterium]|jgi:thiol:disulfide interchange protein DsbC|nr:DsbC family protein [Rhodocyclaceae bacterium]